MKKILYLSFVILNLSKIANGQISLYGMTRGNDAKIIKYDMVNNHLSVVHQFQKQTSPWYNNLIQAQYGKLYGMTTSGGTHGHGLLFSLDPSTSFYQPLYNFDKTNGRSPFGSLVQASNGKHYGLTQSGGSKDSGVLFSFDPSTATYTKLLDFVGQNGRSPYGSLVQASNGKLYGLTESGGKNNMGTVFSFDIETNTYSKLYDFAGKDGRSPYGSLIEASNGKLYGMTQFGGLNGYGTIFSIDPGTNTISTNIHNFDWTKGAWPNSSLLEHNGLLYGMTESGGINWGVVFAFDPISNGITRVENFTSSNGRSPFGDLVKSTNDEFYGMTYRGGVNDLGVLFSVDPADLHITKRKDFDGTNGASPAASLVEVELQNNIPLPLKIFDYNVQVVNRKVKVELVVEEETGIDKYEVQRSQDGLNFTPIAYINAKNQQKRTQYSFYDDQPLPTNFYRIKIHEYYNAPYFTVVKRINLERTELKVLLKSNPITNTISLMMSVPQKQQLAFRLIDLNGRTIKNWGHKTFEPGEHHTQLEISNLKQGHYFLEVKSQQQTYVLKLMK